MKQTNILLLHNIRSVENVGAMFRTADAAGISKIYLSGYSPTPLDRFGRKRSDMAKSALGAEEFVPWEYKKSIAPLIKQLKHDGFQIIGIEQSKEAADYRSIRTKHKNAFIMGTETTGIPPDVLKLCDKIAEIPMHGKKESLNVSVALGIVLFRIL